MCNIQVLSPTVTSHDIQNDESVPATTLGLASFTVKSAVLSTFSSSSMIENHSTYGQQQQIVGARSIDTCKAHNLN